MFPLANSYPVRVRKKAEFLPPQTRSNEEMGGELMTEPKGYCAMYIAMGSEDTHVISRDLHHHDRADWLEEWHGKVHVISPAQCPQPGWNKGLLPTQIWVQDPMWLATRIHLQCLSRVGCSR